MKRRTFLQTTSLPVASTMLNLQMAGHAAASSTDTGNDCKSLVCIYFDGGMDSFHLLVPRDTDRHAVYKQSRGNLHLPLEEAEEASRQPIIPLIESDGGTSGELYGLHASAPELADMFNGAGHFAENPCLSFVANVGSLIKPLTQNQFFAGRPGIDLPVGIGGHFRQAEQWQTAIPQGTVNLRGWLGRAADLLHPGFNLESASMNLSLSGNNLMQSGNTTRPFTFSFGLSNGLSFSNAGENSVRGIKNLFHRRLLGLDHDNLVDQTLAEVSTISLEQQTALREALDAFDESSLVEPFQRNFLDQGLRNILVMIAARETLGLRRQTFFMKIPGWDDHFEIPNAFSGRIASVSRSLARFQRNLNALGLADSVLSFTTSEFARTLRSTGAGSDHAWGGPQMVFGGAIDGGRVTGRFPDLTLRGPSDTGRGGRILPYHSCDEYFREILQWFGVTESQMDIILPNIDNFNGRAPIGFVQT